VSRSRVIIAGGGPVGLATAYGLARTGVDALVLEKEASIGTSPRAMAYLFPVLDGFDDLGILEDLDLEGIRGSGMNLIDHESGEHFPQTLEPLEGLVRHAYTLHLGQDQVSRILLRRLADLPNFEIRYDTALTAVEQAEDGVTVHVASPAGESRLTGGWLIGADGANSAVRRSLDVAFDGITWPDRFVATNIYYDFEAHGFHAANWRIDPVYGAVIAKINHDGLWRFTFREPEHLPLETLSDRIHEHFATALPDQGRYELVQYAPYRMHQRAAASFRVGRVLLAGDAAHVTNPIGGLGLAGGFLDSFVLSEALAAVIAGTVNDTILDAYAARRRRVFLDVVSPAATRNKQMLFDPPLGAGKEQLLATLRDLASDPDKRRDDLLGMRAIVTPSLLAETAASR
jgi:3-(3-hydroxy-phenyl)propionate hydroxylase